MEDQHQQTNTNPRERSTSNNPSESSVRSRWTPKPEQILILESIFNSGMVNPSKEDTIRIRKLLEKFGSVGDANVFYWFQNRRSRSRRRHRQLQAATLAATAPPPPPPPLAADGGFGVPSCSSVVGNPNCPSSCSTALGGVEGVFGNLPAQHELECNFSCSPLIFGSSSASNLEIPSGVITVFINGVATQVPEGALDVKEMFGEEVILVHSSGVPLPSTEFGTSFQTLQHGETYFLVPRLN